MLLYERLLSIRPPGAASKSQIEMTGSSPSTSPYSTPGVYEDDPLLAGYASAENQEALAGSATALVQTRGRGRVIVLLDDPNFRAFWWGTNRLFLNAILLGPVIQGR